MHGIRLSADGWTTDQLYQETEIQSQMLDNLDKLIEKVNQWLHDETDVDAKARLWDRYQGLCRDYSVLASWYNVTYSAYVFSTTGGELHHVTPDGLLLADAILA